MEYTQFREIAKGMNEYAMKLMQEDGYHVPLLFGFGPQWQSMLIDMSDAARSNVPMRDAIAEVGRSLELIAFVMIGECWMVEWHPNMPEEYGPFPSEGSQLRDHPLRKSCIQVCAVHPKGKMMWVTPYSDEGGRIVMGKTHEWEGENVSGGIPNALRRSIFLDS